MLSLCLRVDIDLGEEQEVHTDEGQLLLDAATKYVESLAIDPTLKYVVENCKFMHKVTTAHSSSLKHDTTRCER